MGTHFEAIIDTFIFTAIAEIEKTHSVLFGGLNVTRAQCVDSTGQTFKIAFSKQDEKYQHHAEVVCGFLKNNAVVRKTAVVVSYRKLPLIPKRY